MNFNVLDIFKNSDPKLEKFNVTCKLCYFKTVSFFGIEITNSLFVCSISDSYSIEKTCELQFKKTKQKKLSYTYNTEKHQMS